MVRSMTGFGRGERLDGQYRVTIEIRSVNHRFLEISARLPRRLATLENRIRERLQGQLSRGKVHISVSFDGEASSPANLKINEQLAERYLQIFQEVKARFALRGELDLSSFLNLPEILIHEEEDFSEDSGWGLIADPLAEALERFEQMRAREGELLAKDLRQRLAAIRAAVGRIEEHQPEVVTRIQERLRERLAQISQDVEYNRYRMEVELAIFADRSDVTEECVRLRAHADQFEAALASEEAAGRRLNFLLQEMNREANTIGSKCQDLSLSRNVISLREEVEKIRQQIQNIE